jgi:CheY-like chemotaxis protein
MYGDEEKRWTLNIVKCNLKSMVGTLFATIKPLLVAKRIVYRYSISHNCPGHVLIDMTKLLHVLVNLWSNAIKFTKEGGEIVMEIDHKNGSLVCTVSDSGCGIAHEHRSRLFLNFSQVGDDSQKGSGSGLGLFICRELCTFMGGSIVLKDSVVGQGSTFEVIVPDCCTDHSIVLEIPKMSVENEQKLITKNQSIHCLVVEDNPTNRRMLELSFQKLGCTVTVATDGQEALSIIRRRASSQAFDIIFTDNLMPKISGIDLCRTLRSSAMMYENIIIGASGNVLTEDVHEFLNAGVDMVMGKPVKFSELSVLIKFVKCYGNHSLYFHDKHLMLCENGDLEWKNK